MSSPPPRPSATADPPVGGDVELALLHAPRQHRAALEALFRLDGAMGDTVARSTEPTLGRLKLAWWREALERLDRERPPAEPRLQAVAEHLLPLGIRGAELAELEAGWATLLDPEVDSELVSRRGAILFRSGSRILGESDPRLDEAGALHALVSVGRRGVPELFVPARELAAGLAGHRFPRALRSLTGLARLAARDIAEHSSPEPEGTAGRAAEMLRHRWSGSVVRRR